jgi:hypothetical protein
MEEVLAILKRIVTGIHANEVDGLLADIDKLLSPTELAAEPPADAGAPAPYFGTAQIRPPS